MADIREHRPVLLIVAAFSRFDTALDWAKATLTQSLGEIAIESERFSHGETTFYEPTMGSDLKKAFFAFAKLRDPAELPALKHVTNQWEVTCASERDWGVLRPLNLDPGYLTEAKLVLASTKDRDHRVYLDQGIYAEVTLHFHAGQWRSRPWTYPDYQRADYHEFFLRCRDYLRRQYRSPGI